jgi:hypothetical protein
MVKIGHIPRPQQLQRTRELDRLRCQRPLTDAEKAEADALAYRAEMRAWRAVQADRERRIGSAGQ